MNHHLKKLLFFGFFTALYVCSSMAQRTVQDMLRPTFDSCQVIPVVIDTLTGLSPNNVPLAPQMALPFDTMNVVLDKTRIVGDVPYDLGISIAGQVELSIPIETFASEYESAPQIVLKYNSLGGLTCMGRGWDISGISKIETTNKTFFTDGNVQGRSRNDGPWSLDGNRLILQETNDTAQIFLTQTGNIKVVRDLNGSGYIAYLPDGSKCEYTLSGGYGSLWYPHRNIALDGHILSYSYYNEGNIKLVSRIDYGEDRSLCFSYEEADNEQSLYVDGISLGYGKKLSRIEVKRGDHILRKYVMTYRDNDIKSPLVQVDMLDSVDNAVNPLHFYYYGDQISNGTDSLTDRQLSAFFNSIQDPESYISFRGKLDYMTEDDAVIIYPNKSNYYYNVGSEIVVNDYGTNDHIIINYGLNVSTSTHCTLDAGTGFVDAFCMDVDGRYGEELVKVNQSVTNDSECMQFSVYRLMINGLIPIDTVNIYQNALMHKGKKTLWPTQFLTGDFTGNGKEEVLMCRTDSPLGESEPAMVSMIRLDSGTVIYTGTLEKFHLYIPVYPADDEMNIARTRGSDRLFASDLDGDGKLELCVLNTSGLDIYRFGYNASGQVVKSKSRNNNLLLSQAYDYIVTVGDVNGDGNIDQVYLPDVANKSDKSLSVKGG